MQRPLLQQRVNRGPFPTHDYAAPVGGGLGGGVAWHRAHRWLAGRHAGSGAGERGLVATKMSGLVLLVLLLVLLLVAAPAVGEFGSDP